MRKMCKRNQGKAAGNTKKKKISGEQGRAAGNTRRKNSTGEQEDRAAAGVIRERRVKVNKAEQQGAQREKKSKGIKKTEQQQGQ